MILLKLEGEQLDLVLEAIEDFVQANQRVGMTHIVEVLTPVQQVLSMAWAKENLQ